MYCEFRSAVRTVSFLNSSVLIRCTGDRDVMISYGKPAVPIRLMRIGICAKLAETLAANNYYK